MSHHYVALRVWPCRGWTNLAAAGCLVSAVAVGCRLDKSPEPSIASVRPTEVTEGTTSDLEVVGNHLVGKINLSLDNRQAPSFDGHFELWLNERQLSEVRFTPPNTLSAPIPIDMESGQYTVRVKTPAEHWTQMPLALTVRAQAGALPIPDAGAGSTNAAQSDSDSDSRLATPLQPGPADSGVAAPTSLKTQGPKLLGPCGNDFVARGVEQVLGGLSAAGTSSAEVLGNIADTGANAVRVYPQQDVVLSELEGDLQLLAARNVVTFLAPPTDNWLAEPTVQAALNRHASHLVLDAYYPKFSDRTRFATEAAAAVTQVRGYGYAMPLHVMSNHYGRDLPALLQYGDSIVAADPEQNVVLGWTAWWSDSNWYQTLYSMTLNEAAQQAAAANFPILLSITDQTDRPPENSEFMDYAAFMTTVEGLGLGWLWSHWYEPSDPINMLSNSGSETDLLPLGLEVVTTHAAGIANTSTLPCAMR